MSDILLDIATNRIADDRIVPQMAELRHDVVTIIGELLKNFNPIKDENFILIAGNILDTLYKSARMIREHDTIDCIHAYSEIEVSYIQRKLREADVLMSKLEDSFPQAANYMAMLTAGFFNKAIHLTNAYDKSMLLPTASAFGAKTMAK